MPSSSFSFRETAVRDRAVPITSALSETMPWINSLGAIAVMSGVLGLCWAEQLAQQLGSGSEELFRGDRLPLLPTLPVLGPPSSKIHLARLNQAG